MLNGVGSEKGEKKTLGLISEKTTLRVQHTFLYTLLCRCCLNVKLLVTRFMEKMLHVFTKNFVACVPVRNFFFHCRLFSPCWPLALLIFSPPV